MKRILLDHNIPFGLRAILADYDVMTAHHPGWQELLNGELIAQAENAGFEVLITADQNLRYQQNLSDRRIALIILETNRWRVLRSAANQIRAGIEQSGPGGFIELRLPAPASDQNLRKP